MTDDTPVDRSVLPGERERLELGATFFDPITWRHLLDLGDLDGRTVLDAGAGRGRLSRWFSERVGATGSVLAVDRNQAHLDDHGDVPYERRLVDLTDLSAVPERFDVVFSRFVLDQVTARDDVVRALARRLRPGGTLFLQDIDLARMAAAGDADYAAVARAHYEAQVGRGFDFAWIRGVPRLLEEAGLVDVRVREEVMWLRSGSHLARFTAAALVAHEDEMLAHVEQALVERALRVLLTGDAWLPAMSIWSVWGRAAA